MKLVAPCLDRTCPWCGKAVKMGILKSIEPGEEVPAELIGTPVVVHEEPRCAVFEQIDGDAFVESLDGMHVPRGAA